MKITDKPVSAGLSINAGQRKYDAAAVEGPKPSSPSVQVDIKVAELDQSTEIDDKLVAAIRQRLQSGEFKIDYDAVAESVLHNAMAFSNRGLPTSK